MDIKGTVKAVLPIETGDGKNGAWSKQTVVIEIQSGNYTNILALQNMKKAQEFGQLKVGQRGKFAIDLKSREYNGKYYTDVICFAWDLEDTSEDMPV